MQHSYTYLCLALFILVGCSRKVERDASVLRIETPKSVSQVSALAGLPSGFKVCYGINVTAPDISNTSLPCGSPLGVFKGFVAAGSNLEVSLPSGIDRKVELFAYLSTDTSASCPSWTSTCTAAVNCNLFRVATATGISMKDPEVSLTMTVDFPGFSQNTVVTDSSSNLCTAQTRGGLNMAGEIVDANFQSLGASLASAAFASVYSQSQGTGFEAVTRSMFSTESPSFSPRPQLRAISRKPDTGELYGMTSDRKLVKMLSDGDYIELSGSSCPFPTCSLPSWFKSFSVGNGISLFGLDWGGNVWKVTGATSVTPAGSGIPLHIQQLVFH